MKKPSKLIKKFYNKGEKYLFLGNGINLLSEKLSWKTLLKRISNTAGVSIDFTDKTYPLIFEEIAFSLGESSNVDDSIKSLKEVIDKECAIFKPNRYHKSIIALNYYQHFITTNYDYCIEKTIDASCDLMKAKNGKIPKYSMHRFNLIHGKKIWHIHGELDNGIRGKKIGSQNSIMIGNEHYGDYLRKVHDLIKGKGGLYRLMESSKENWVHLFFSRDIDIIGFGMNFNESHLWLILNFRARMIRKRVGINNRISFYYPSFSSVKMKAILDLLRILEISVVPIKVPKNDYPKFYNEFVNIKMMTDL